ncbi:MAG: CvpA family protein [Clostridia bacterium]|nr:CvpA family protein [Clostridia bacterium]
MTVSLVFDIVILVICAIIIIKNAVRGFIKSFITFSKTILAFLLAYLFNAPVARFLSDKIFLGCARGWIYDAFCSTQIGEDQYALYQLFDGIPEWFTNATVSSGVEDWMVQEYFVNEQPAPMWALNKMSNSLGEELSYLISVVVAFLAIFLIAEIVIGILGIFLNKLGQKSMLKVINVILGACIGLVISAFIAWIIAFCVLWVLDFGGKYYPDVFSRELLNESWTIQFFEKYDIWSWIKGIFS